MDTREELQAQVERLQAKVDAFTNGDTFLVLKDEDIPKAACDLDDLTLAKWARWALVNAHNIYSRKADKQGQAVAEVIGMHAVITLALHTLATNAERATFSVEGVTYKGEPKGDWRVTIERIAQPSGDPS